MATLAAIEKQIAALQKKAAALRKAGLSAVAAKVKALIAQHGLSADDLGLAGKSSAKVKNAGPARKSPPAKPAGVPKYQDPASSKTWTGVGKPPAWIAGAKQRDAFLIGAAGKPTATPAAIPAVKKPASRKAAPAAAAAANAAQAAPAKKSSGRAKPAAAKPAAATGDAPAVARG